MEKDTGGHAFPKDGFSGYIGMSMRDYFAAKAMQSLIAHGVSEAHIHRHAYRFADAMLAERSKP
jgi:hypothetical protein